jgi:hypothetical protein
VESPDALNPSRPAVEGRTGLCILFCMHAAAMAAYAVPFPNVLDAHGMRGWLFLAVSTGSVASFISPMMAASLADRRVAPERLLAGLTFIAGILLALVHASVQFNWGHRWFLGLMMAYALANAPGFSLVTSVALSRLSDPRREFAPIRVWATWGWMAASFLVSRVFHLDRSPVAGYVGAGIFVAEAIFCLSLKPTPPPPGRAPRRWRDVMGWEALPLLRHPDHRLIFLTSAAFSAVMSTLYVHTVPHLKAGGDATPAATMALAQLCEGLAMLAVSGLLLRFRIKWLLTAGLLLGVARYVLLGTDARWAMVASVALHGPLFVLFYMTSQIYLELRIDPGIRAQSQALLSLMNNGIGNLVGYQVIDVWYRACGRADGTTDWVRFWNWLAVAAAVLTVVFLMLYKGQRHVRAGREPS